MPPRAKRSAESPATQGIHKHTKVTRADVDFRPKETALVVHSIDCKRGSECPEACHVRSAKRLLSRSDEYWWENWIDEVYPFRLMSSLSSYGEPRVHYVTCTAEACPNHSVMDQLFRLIEVRADGPAADHMYLGQWGLRGKKLIGSILASELAPVVRPVAERRRWQDWTEEETAAITKALTARTHVVPDCKIPNYEYFKEQLECYLLAHPRECIEMDPFLIVVDPTALSANAGRLDAFLAPNGRLDVLVAEFDTVSKGAMQQVDGQDPTHFRPMCVPHPVSRLVYATADRPQAHAFAAYLKQAEPDLVCVVVPYTNATSITWF